MSEISIRQQIKQIENLKQYIALCTYEVQKLRDDVGASLRGLRKEGLALEYADAFEGHMYLGHVFGELDKLTSRMRGDDYRFLDEVQKKLEETL